MSHHGYQMGSSHNGGGIDPNAVNYGASYHGGYGISGSSAPVFSTGGAMIDDDDLLDGLSPTDPPSGLPGPDHDFNGMNGINQSYGQEIYGSNHNVPLNQAQINGYSNTPDGDPIQSPYINNGFANQYRGMGQTFAGAMHTPLSYASSPLGNGGITNDANGADYLKAHRMSSTMQRKASNQRSPLPAKTIPINGMSLNTHEGFPIRTHDKPQATHYMQPTPSSLQSLASPGQFSSPSIASHIQNPAGLDSFMKTGMSMPTKMPSGGQVSSQEAKRKRRRESHNLVERRRRDNINERIQDLSKLVPAHRLEDEKIRKAIQNGTPLSPSLNGISSPGAATSSLAAPGARRANPGTAGNITTGLPLDEKDKGPNKGDILNGAVSWTRDLMWMLHLKLQQQEELMNTIIDLGGTVPFEFSDDERRMQTELFEALSASEAGKPDTFSYSRTAGTGLRVPQHTDYKGEPLDPNGNSTGGGGGNNHISISPDANGHNGHNNGDVSNDMLDSGEFLDYDDDDNKYEFKEEDEFMIDQ